MNRFCASATIPGIRLIRRLSELGGIRIRAESEFRLRRKSRVTESYQV